MPKDAQSIQVQSELELWKNLHGTTVECRKARVELRTNFKCYFEAGHQTRIDDFVNDMANKAKRGEVFEYPFEHCANIHPRAWDILLKYGKHYTPQSWGRSKPWDWESQPVPHACFLNSFILLFKTRRAQPKSRATYVEGFCTGPLVEPMLHAWNGVGFAGRAVDWTFYAHTMFNRYFGVPFTLEEYMFINDNDAHFTIRMMFRRDNFEKVESRLLEVLQKPRTRLMRATA